MMVALVTCPILSGSSVIVAFNACFIQVNCKSLHSLTLLKNIEIATFCWNIDPESTHGQRVKLKNMLVVYINALSTIKNQPL